MENFKQKLRGGFEYLTAPIGDITKLEVYYYKGDRQRGVLVSMRDTKREQGDGYVSESFVLYQGKSLYFYILPLLRKSDKQELAVAEIIDSLVPQIMQLWNENKLAEVRTLMQDAVNAKQMK